MSPSWTQGSDYGSWYDYNPVMWLYNKATGQDPYTADQEAFKSAVSGAVTTATNAAVSGYQAYSKAQADAAAAAAAAAAAEAARKKAEEEAAAAHTRNMAIGAACTLAVGIGGFMAYRNYKKTGHLLPTFGASPAHV